MKKELTKEIEIPHGVNVTIEDSKVIVKGELGENSRIFQFGRVEIKIEGNKIILGNKKATKTEKKLMHTIAAHITNMIQGIQEKFEYELKICYGHFPFTVKQEGNKFIIKNFLGEKVDRETYVPEGVEVEVKKDFIVIKSIDKELAGQAAANFEQITKIKGRDKRIFQDGIYITKKCGKVM